jgi:ferredoxin
LNWNTAMLTIALETRIRDTFRVQQVVGMFDLPLQHASRLDLEVELPAADEPWTIGAIVGPSGSGKTTIARAAFGIQPCRRRWPRNRAVIDAFGGLPIRRLLALLAAVGLNSPPAWLRPYHLLSTGEKFRCDLAWRLRRFVNPLPSGEGGSRSELGEGRPRPGEGRSRQAVVEFHATTCDLCGDIVGNDWRNVSCVHACPHEAAFRMKGEELLKIVGG